jgi:hypothetical protein
MPLLQNLLGQRFGDLTVLRAAPNSRGGRTRWICSCTCEGKTVVASCHLISGHTRSCGCLRHRTAGARFFKNLLGQRFGRLVVLARAGSDKHGRAIWLCACDCKNEVVLSSSVLVQGHTRSCGCLRREVRRELNSTHRMSGTPEYRVYQAAKSRCTNPNDRSFANYGGRGIQFRYPSFESFFADLGQCPPGRSLDRRNVNGNYEPGNCGWATRSEQASNRRPAGRRRSTLAAIQAYASALAAAGSNGKSMMP